MRTDPLKTTSASRSRIGVVLLGLEKANVPALQYLVLHANGLQSTFEFEFLPPLEGDAVLHALASGAKLERQQIKAELPEFSARYRKHLEGLNEEFGLREPAPGKFVIVCLARFVDMYYSTRVGDTSVIALGNWKKHMAPPSIAEFILTLLVREAAATLAPALRTSVHLGTKGCICDFTATLADVRFKVLNGYVCGYCSNALVDAGYADAPLEIRRILARRWLGGGRNASSPAAIVRKLGYDLFTTSGLRASRWERLLSGIESEGPKQVLTIVATVLATLVGAALLARLGLPTK